MNKPNKIKYNFGYITLKMFDFIKAISLKWMNKGKLIKE
jgi:hypothetical protein